MPLYDEIYNHRKSIIGSHSNRKWRPYAAEHHLPYRVNGLPYGRSEKGTSGVGQLFLSRKDSAKQPIAGASFSHNRATLPRSFSLRRSVFTLEQSFIPQAPLDHRIDDRQERPPPTP